MFPMGASVAGSTFVSNFLGLDDYKSAIRSAFVSVFYAGCWSFTLGLILFFTHHDLFPSFFTPDVEVTSEAAKVIPFLAFYVFADGLQAAFNGIIRGCGTQFYAMLIVVFAYWFVGVPLSYYFAFTVNDGKMEECNVEWICGIKGLVAGLTIGTWTHMILLALLCIFFTDFEVEAHKARKRIGLENGGCDVKNSYAADMQPLV